MDQLVEASLPEGDGVLAFNRVPLDPIALADRDRLRHEGDLHRIDAAGRTPGRHGACSRRDSDGGCEQDQSEHGEKRFHSHECGLCVWLDHSGALALGRIRCAREEHLRRFAGPARNARGFRPRETVIASFGLETGDRRAAVVFPVPGRPEVELVEADPLGYLDLATAPAPQVTSGDSDGAGGPPEGVDLISGKEIGGYFIETLSATDPGALNAYLDEASTSCLRGRARLTQLGSDPVNLTLYTLADEARSVDGLEVAYEGEVADLEPGPDAEVAALLEPGAYLTKLTAMGADPASFTEDLVIEEDDPEDVAVSSEGGHSLVGFLLFLFSLLR